MSPKFSVLVKAYGNRETMGSQREGGERSTGTHGKSGHTLQVPLTKKDNSIIREASKAFCIGTVESKAAVKPGPDRSTRGKTGENKCGCHR